MFFPPGDADVRAGDNRLPPDLPASAEADGYFDQSRIDVPAAQGRSVTPISASPSDPCTIPGELPETVHG